MMKKNSIFLILGICLVLLAVWLYVNNTSGTIQPELKDFAFADTGSITKIFLADKANNSVLLEKVKPGEWMVNKKHKVRVSAINILLYTIKNLDVKSPVGKKMQPNIIKRLAADAVKIEIYAGEELKKLYYVGGETQDQLGTYMLLADPETMENSSVPFVMYIPGFNGYLTPRYFTSEYEWKAHILFSYIPSDIKSIKVEIPPKPEYSFEISALGNNKYSVKTGNKTIENLDTLAVKQYLSYYQYIVYGATDGTLTERMKDSIVNSQPMHIITVTDSKGIENKVRLFSKAAPNTSARSGIPVKYDDEKMYVVSNNEKELLQVTFFAFGKLLPAWSVFEKKTLL